MLRNVEKQSGRTPKALQDRPTLYPDLEEYHTAFLRLSRSRRHGMTVEAISFTEMQAYCEMFDVEDRELFVRLIQAADEVYLDWVNGNGRKHSD